MKYAALAAAGIFILAGGFLLWFHYRPSANDQLVLAGDENVAPTTSIAEAMFDPFSAKPGDHVGRFVLATVNAEHGSENYPYDTFYATFTGTSTVEGILSTEVGIIGPTLSFTSTSTKDSFPHREGGQGPSAIEIDSQGPVPGSETVHNGDLVEAVISSPFVMQEPKDGSPYGANLVSIRQITPAPKRQYLSKPLQISELSITVPAGWNIVSNTMERVGLESPDFSTRDTLADIFTTDIPTVVSGRQVNIEYLDTHLAPGMTSQSFVDFENSIQSSNCTPGEQVSFAGNPAFMTTCTQAGDVFTQVLAARGVDEVTFYFSPGIRTDADRTFVLGFLSGITYVKP